MGTKCIRIENLPSEVSNDTLRATLAPYGKFMDIQDERWSKANRYAVANGVLLVTMLLSRHVPSHLTVAGHRVLLSYEGQPATCYGCGEVNHTYKGCPVCHKSGTVRPNLTKATYASIVTAGVAPTENQMQDFTSETGSIADIGSAKSTMNCLRMPGEKMDINVAQTLAPDISDTRTTPALPDVADTVFTDTV